MSRFAAAFSLALLATCSFAAATAPSAPRPVGVLLDDPSPATRRMAASGIAALGGRVLHRFDDVLVVALPSGSELTALRLPGVREVALNAWPRTGSRGSEPSPGRAAWNAIAAGWAGGLRAGPSPEPLADDALPPPVVSLDAVRAASRGAAMANGGRLGASIGADVPAASAPYGATALNTSEFLAGTVSVNVILVESDGSIDPSTENWSSTREAEVVARIATGLEWVRTQEPAAALGFVYHVIAGRMDPRARTGYEPIRRAADPNGTTGEDLWVKDVLGRFGYASGDRFARSRALAADTRAADGTDWAVNVFVVDSLADADGKFADGRFAYTWIGGPHVVMTYDNGSWGSARMDMVIRHEILHAFYAFDEYAGSACTCVEHRGYLDGANANCETCNPVARACVMIANGDAMCAATRRQVGWADLDGDGVIDVIGENPDTFLDPMPPLVCAMPVLSGLATVVAATDRNTFGGFAHPSISVSRVARVEVRADGGAWSPAGADGASDVVPAAPQNRFSAAFASLAPGPHVLEARAVDDFGNTDAQPGSVRVDVEPGVSPLGASVRASRGSDGGVAVWWDACPGATLYRVYRRSTPGGPENAVVETAATHWTDPGTASGYYQVRPVDACGEEDAD